MWDAGTLYDTVMQRLFTLPEGTLFYPAHDYKGRTVPTIGGEKRLNTRFADRSGEQFIKIMSHLGFSYPKKMNEAVAVNEYCGDFIPEASLNNGTSAAINVEREKVELTLSTNTEIYEDYLARYI
ncbi:hypothetical protein NDA07_23485 [Microcoleus vaginatus DQ-U2]|uniref:hypothetical protein n=1 Tax=Microcoleus vaginatus TaxID=119532 RepID=UPI0032A8FA1D